MYAWCPLVPRFFLHHDLSTSMFQPLLPVQSPFCPSNARTSIPLRRNPRPQHSACKFLPKQHVDHETGFSNKEEPHEGSTHGGPLSQSYKLNMGVCWNREKLPQKMGRATPIMGWGLSPFKYKLIWIVPQFETATQIDVVQRTPFIGHGFGVITLY